MLRDREVQGAEIVIYDSHKYDILVPEGARVIRFRWNEWNLDKIAAHGLSSDDVEYAFNRRLGPHQEREDGSYETLGPVPSGRVILIVWRYDEEFDALEEDCVVQVVFVITAY